MISARELPWRLRPLSIESWLRVRIEAPPLHTQCATEIEVGRAFLDKLICEHVAGKYLVKECSMAKLWQTEMQGRVIDACLQLYGGYGYMLEYPISRAYMDARVQRIYAGTNEIMKVIIAKQMGL